MEKVAAAASSNPASSHARNSSSQYSIRQHNNDVHVEEEKHND